MYRLNSQLKEENKRTTIKKKKYTKNLLLRKSKIGTEVFKSDLIQL